MSKMMPINTIKKNIDKNFIFITADMPTQTLG